MEISKFIPENVIPDQNNDAQVDDTVLEGTELQRDFISEFDFEKILGELVPNETIESHEKIRTSLKRVIIPEYFGPCAGVNAAYELADEALTMLRGRTLHTHNPLVHNNRVNEGLVKRGLKIHSDRDENGDYDIDVIPDGEPYIISAHGYTPDFKEKLIAKGCVILDATCPLVVKSHNNAVEASNNGEHIILFGQIKNGTIHPEPRGIIGNVPEGSVTLISSKEDAIDFVPQDGVTHRFMSQTTQSKTEIQENKDIIQQKIPDLQFVGGKQVCYATDHRQDAMGKLAQEVPVVMVLTSEISNNGTNLIKRAKEHGIPAYLIESFADIKFDEWFPEGSGIEEAGLSAAASCPEWMINELVEELRRNMIEVDFKIPKVPEKAGYKFPLPHGNITGLRKYIDSLPSQS